MPEASSTTPIGPVYRGKEEVAPFLAARGFRTAGAAGALPLAAVPVVVCLLDRFEGGGCAVLVGVAGTLLAAGCPRLAARFN